MFRSVSRACTCFAFAGILVLTSAGRSQAGLNLVSSSPSHGQVGVPTDAPIVLSFSAPLLAASVVVDSYPACLTLEPSTGDRGAVITFQASLSADRRILVLTHTVPFRQSQAYALTLNTPPASPCLRQDDAARTPLTPGPVPHAVLFSTLDDTPPTIVVHNPPDGGDLQPNSPVTVTFSEPIAPETLRVTADPPVTFSVSVSDGGRTVALLPAPVGSPTSCTISLYVEDASGNPIRPDGAAPHERRNPWIVILTPAGPDTARPRLLTCSPTDGGTQVDISASIVLRFDEPVRPSDSAFPAGPSPMVVTPSGSGGTWSAEFSQSGDVLILRHSQPLVPNALHTVSIPAFALRDLSSNPLAADIRLTFHTADVTPPCVAATVPADGAVDVDGTAPITVIFSEPMQAASIRIELRPAGGPSMPGTDVELSNDGTTATVTHPALPEDGSAYELTIISAKDLSGADIVPGVLPDNTLRFRTKDVVGPILEAVHPANGATVPPHGAQICITFSEAVSAGVQGTAPLLRLSYLSGEGGPTPLSSSAEQVELGVWRCVGGFSQDARTVRVDLQPLRPGDVVVAELLYAEDTAHNALRRSGAPTLWTFRVSDDGPPVLLELSPTPGALVGQSTPVVIRTSKPLNTDSLRFEADGDWSQCAALVSGRTWKAGRRAFSSDGKVITLTHAPFTDAPPGQQNSHTFRIISAYDFQFRNLIAAPGVSFETSFFTGSRPRVEKVQFQWPKGAQLTADGLLPAGCPTEWHDLSADPNCVVPRNSPLRAVFSQRMDPASVPPLVSDPPLGAWQLQWETDLRAVVMTHTALLPDARQQWIRGHNGEIMPSPAPITVSLTYGLDAKGDVMYPYVSVLRPADAAPPDIMVEYLCNPLLDGSIPTVPEWAPLDGAVGVPVNTTLRIRSTETLAPDGVTVAGGGSWGVDIAEAQPIVSDRGDWNGVVGSEVLVRFTEPLCGGVLVGDPPMEQRAAYSIVVGATDASPLANTARIRMTFHTRDALPPRLASISPAQADDPRAGLRLTFTEPVDPNTLAVADLKLDGRDLPGLSMIPTDQPAAFLLSYTAPPNPPGTDLTYCVQILPGAADTAGNAQQDASLLNHPRGQSDRILIAIPAVSGDIDGDGRFSTADVLLLFRFFTGIGTPTAGQLRAAEAVGSRPTASDVVRLLRKLVSR